MYLGKTKRVHFIGIGGSGMNGIAEVLINQGYEVTGSDVARSRVTDHLKKIGAKIHYRHAVKNVEKAQVVVVSSAIKPDNVEVLAAREKMVPVIPRAEMLAELMRMKHGIAIAGTHGKTTTTSLIATVLAAGKLDPTVVIGGRLNSLGSHAQMGKSEFLVAEADESDGSFLRLSPTIAVVTTLDEEHMDYYGTLERMKQDFLSFINRIPFYGAAVLCLDDPNIQSLIPGAVKRCITYGLTSQGDYTARNIAVDGLKTGFTVHYRGRELGPVVVRLAGRHNVCNALAAIAVGMELNLKFEVIAGALREFPGVHRRFEIVHQSDVTIVDDYGHHPAEIQATLAAARDVWPDRRLLVAFQPHRYSRTQHLLAQFCTSFNNTDVLLVNKIYAAGETPVEGVDARRIADGVKQFGHKNAEYLETKKEIVAYLRKNIRPGDVIMTLGAGDIWEVGRDLAAKLSPAPVKPPSKKGQR